MNSNGTVIFIEELKQQAIAMGWITHVFTILIPQPDCTPSINCPFFSQYGLILVNKICQHTLTNVSAKGSQSALDNMVCYMCIMMSMSEEGRKISLASCRAIMWMTNVLTHLVWSSSRSSWIMLLSTTEPWQPCTTTISPLSKFTLG